MCKMKGEDYFAPEPYEYLISNKSLGYSLPEAIADLIDNSLSAGAQEIEIKIIAKEDDNFDIYIHDNGIGMNLITLIESFRPSVNSTKQNRSISDLGRFGMGMKTASLSLTNKLHVVSRKNGEINGRSLDLDIVKETRSWILGKLDVNECTKKFNSAKLTTRIDGTTLHLENCTTSEFDSTARVAERVLNYCSVVYHRFISRGIKIDVNAIRATAIPIIPSLAIKIDDSPYSANEELKYAIYLLPNESEISMNSDGVNLDRYNSYYLDSNILDQQGVYLYRSDRLISIKSDWYGILSKKQKFRLARVEVEIDSKNDSLWGVNIMKNRVLFPKYMRERLRIVVKTATRKSVQAVSGAITEGIQQLFRGDIHPWSIYQEEGLSKVSINLNNPIIKSYFASFSENRIKSLSMFLSTTFPYREIGQLYGDGEGFVSSLEQVESLFDELVIELMTLMSKEEAEELLRSQEPFKSLYNEFE